MTAIAPTTTSFASAAAGGSSPAHSLLDARMDDAMSTARAVGRPVDAAGAAAILGTGASYVQGAGSTAARLEVGIQQRAERLRLLEQDPASDPAFLAKERQQLELLERLRERILQSIERVGEILAGDREEPVDGGDGGAAVRRRAQLDLLEERRQLLQPSFGASEATRPDLVLEAYANAVGVRG